MILRDFLYELKSECTNFIVTSATDGTSGMINYSDGKYFDLGDDMRAVENDKLEEYLTELNFPEEFYSDWMYREVINVNPVLDLDYVRSYADEGFKAEPMPSINICVEQKEGDDDLFENPQAISDEWPFGEWPYRLLSKEKYDALEELFYKSKSELFALAVFNILHNGLMAASDITDDDITEAGESEERQASILKMVHDIAAHIDNAAQLYAFVRLFQPMNETMTL